MLSKRDLNLMEHIEYNLEFSIARFLLYGWFGWIVSPLIFLPLLPFLFIKYLIITGSVGDAKHFVNLRMHIASKIGLGYVNRSPQFLKGNKVYKPKKKGLKIILTFAILLFLFSLITENTTKLNTGDSISVGTNEDSATKDVS